MQCSKNLNQSLQVVSEVNGEPVYVICEKSYKLEALQQHSEQPADVPGSVKTSKL